MALIPHKLVARGSSADPRLLPRRVILEAAEERALAALWQASLEEVGRLTDAEWESPARRRQGLAAWYAVLRDVAPVLDRLGVAGIVLPPQPAA